MEKAKQAVSSFLSHDGKHKTTVEEDVRGAVTEEHVMPHQHEHVTTAIDKEVHQHHHHTTVQPITHKETLPEQHTHNAAPVEHKEFHHGNDRDVRSTLERDAAKYRDTSVTHETKRTQEAAPVVAGERVHHHVHEHVQPVINKEVVQPHVVHTTIPIHETHHLEAIHHGTSVLPTKTLHEFAGGAKNALEGRSATQLNEYEGCPKPYKKEMQSETLEGDKHMHLHSHGDQHSHHHGGAAAGVGAAGAVGAAGLAHKHRERRGSNSSYSSSDDEKRRTRGTRSGRTAGTTGIAGTTGSNVGHHGSNTLGHTGGNNLGQTGNTLGQTGGNTLGQTGGNTLGQKTGHNTLGQSGNNLGQGGVNNHALGQSGTDTTAKKPSVMDRLNPMKDADGDGKKGLMD